MLPHSPSSSLIMGPCLNSWPYSVSRYTGCFLLLGSFVRRETWYHSRLRDDIDLGLEEDVLEDVMESKRKARGRRPFLCGGEKVNDTSA